VTDERDRIDAWLEREVTPLMPRAGSLERIRRTARRRKATQAVMAAAGCAVVIAAAAVVPQLSGAFSHPGAGNKLSGQAEPSSSSASAQPSRGGTVSPATTGATPLKPSSHSYLSKTTSGYLPPVSFRPTSVTFAPTGTGQVVGAVIGQAGNATHPCATSHCTSLAGTSNYGTSWYGVSAPLTDAPNGSTGVSQLRFVNLKDGWAFGPALWYTTGGGWPWHQANTHGMRVIALEAAGSHALAIFAQCAGTGADYASSCTSFSLYTSVAGSPNWTPVQVPGAFRQMSTAIPSSASLTILESTGYLLAPTGQLLRGPVAGGSWTVAGQAPCLPGRAQAGGLPADAQLAAWPALVLACDSTTGTGNHRTTIYTSATGTSWTRAGVLATAGAATSLAATPSGQLVLATTAGIYFSADHGATWQAAVVQQQPPGGFSWAGMTNANQGVAVPATATLGEVFVTTDAGRTWYQSPITG
jgi:hypothetical protein